MPSVRSSPAYAGLALELPAVTVADRVAVVLVLAAGAFVGSIGYRQGFAGVAVSTASLAVGVAVMQWRIWTRSRLLPPARLELLPGGSLQVRLAGQGATPARLGHRTRRLGPSVFLELHFASGGRRMRYGRWLTAWDVPTAVLRRWSVVLPVCGRAACS
jgi:hypothetical protein